jgi:hypothetical protein
MTERPLSIQYRRMGLEWRAPMRDTPDGRFHRKSVPSGPA